MQCWLLDFWQLALQTAKPTETQLFHLAPAIGPFSAALKFEPARPKNGINYRDPNPPPRRSYRRSPFDSSECEIRRN